MSDEVIQELFVALTSRWVRPDGRLAIGVPTSRLAQTLRLEPPALRAKLQEVQDKVAELGLEVRSYTEDGEEWQCICAATGGPVDLDLLAQGVLGVIIRLALERRTRSVPLKLLKDALIRRDYITESELQRIIRDLDRHGYIRRKKGSLSFGFRTQLEFTEEALQQIKEEVASTIF